MEKRTFGRLGEISALSLGGGGIGGVFGPTSLEEAVATAREAATAGITLFDVAPGYGRGEAERVIGEAFHGQLPNGVRISTKCNLGSPAANEALPLMEASLDASLERMRLEWVDLLFWHSQILSGDSAGGEGTPRSLFSEIIVEAFERLVSRGRIGAWGISGIAVPSAIIETLEDDPAPTAVLAIANLLDSSGDEADYDQTDKGPASPRDIIATAHRRGVAVMGIRAVQAGALTDGLDRDVPQEDPIMVDFRRAGPFRALARGIGESQASLAHRYALSMRGISTVVLGVKNRSELRECVAAEAMGPLDPELISRIDKAVAG
jgi:aryl-alcohol dehydrogenase-like predicted oxidoreductase